MFIGEAPGAEEDRQGLPFVGRAGGLLNELLAGIGLSREDVFIANVAQMPASRQPRSAADRDRHLPALSARAGRADPAEGDRDARELRDEADHGQPDRDHAGPRHSRRSHTLGERTLQRLPDPPSGRDPAQSRTSGG